MYVDIYTHTLKLHFNHSLNAFVKRHDIYNIFFHLKANTLLPPECSSHTHCLPTLMNIATSFQVTRQERG